MTPKRLNGLTRRQALGALSGLGAAAGLGTLAASIPRAAHTAGEDYRALVVVWLDGGNDGHNVLVPTDTAAYNEYQSGRGPAALTRNELSALPAPVNGRQFGMHPSLTPLLPLYTQGRLAFLANVGPLVRPVTAAAVRAGTAELPPFLGQHVEQSQLVQGAEPHGQASGWAGRALEALPAELRHAHAGLATWFDGANTLVQGERTVATMMSSNHSTWMGWGDAGNPDSGVMPSLARMQRWQQDNAYAAEHLRSVMRATEHLAFLGRAYEQTSEPGRDFGPRSIGRQLRGVAQTLPWFRQNGSRRQVFQVVEPGFDHHVSLLSQGDWRAQDMLLGHVAQALASFDAEVRAKGLDNNVVTLVMSEFGRTLRSNQETGSEHGWGNHWWAFGGPVVGGTVHGSFPSLALNGADDADGEGTLVPTTASDQVAAAALQWLGLPAGELTAVLPNLAHFVQKSVPFIRT